jgi:predicted alpha/beta hydrolase family esterase
LSAAVPNRHFLLLHGFSHHRPSGHWQYWLANRLRARGERVLYPGLPFEDEPRYEEWLEAMHWALAQLGDDGERIVVCNSLACVLWLDPGTPATPPGRPIDQVLLVAPPIPDRIPDAAATFRSFELDVGAVRAASRQPIRFVFSDNDPFNPDGGAKAYAAALDAEVDLIPGAGHLGPIEGYGPWPLLEAWCLDPAVRIEQNFPPLELP